MAVTTPASNSRTDQETEIPADIETGTSKLVYLYLHTHGPSLPKAIASALNIRLLSLFPILDTLVNNNHLTESESGYHCNT